MVKWCLPTPFPIVLFLVFLISGLLGGFIRNFGLILRWDLFYLNRMGVGLPIIVDSLSLFFLAVVRYISSMVLRFRKYYMKGEEGLGRFYGLVIVFIVSMCLLIFIPRYIGILLG